MENNLENIVEIIKARREVVATEKSIYELVNPFAQRTRLGQIRRAKEDLKELYLQYRTELKQRAAFILTTGSQRDEYASLAEKDFGCFSLDANTFYLEILAEVPARLYTNMTSSPGLFDHFAARFGDRALDIEIIGHPPLLFESKYKKVLTGEDDALALMKRAFNNSIGGEVVGLDAIHRVASKAVNENFIEKTVPIILLIDDELLLRELAKDLKKLTPNVFVVSTGTKINKDIKNISIASIKSITDESVKSSLLKIKENLS